MPLWNCHIALFCHFTHVIPLLSSCSQSAPDIFQGSAHESERTGASPACENAPKMRRHPDQHGCSRRQCRSWGSWKDPCPPFRRCDLSLPRGLPGRDVRALGSAGRLCRNHGCSVATAGQSKCLYSLVKSKDSLTKHMELWELCFSEFLKLEKSRRDSRVDSKCCRHAHLFILSTLGRLAGPRAWMLRWELWARCFCGFSLTPLCGSGEAWN